LFSAGRSPDATSESSNQAQCIGPLVLADEQARGSLVRFDQEAPCRVPNEPHSDREWVFESPRSETRARPERGAFARDDQSPVGEDGGCAERSHDMRDHLGGLEDRAQPRSESRGHSVDHRLPTSRVTRSAFPAEFASGPALAGPRWASRSNDLTGR
jgi:hypothetical protein